MKLTVPMPSKLFLLLTVLVALSIGETSLAHTIGRRTTSKRQMMAATSAISVISQYEPNQDRLKDLIHGFQSGYQVFIQEVKQGGFTALTGVEMRQAIELLEGTTFTQDEQGITYILKNGTLIPPLSQAGYAALKNTLPAEKRYVLDEKFFWLLQRNPALPLIAADLERGDYQGLLQNGVFDTDAYYLGPFMGYMFWAAQKAGVELEELLPLIEIHFITLENPYFQDLQSETSGNTHSFYTYEQELTNKQYLMRTFLMTPLEPWARLEAIKQVESSNIKKDYTGSQTTSTTVALGRLPLPTPTAAEDTPGVHALNIAHLQQQEISLFPPAIEEAASVYTELYKSRLEEEDKLRKMLQTLAATHSSEILTAIEYYQSERFWKRIGITSALNTQSVSQMDTSRLLGIFATRLEALKKLPAEASYQSAKDHFIDFFQYNSPGLDDTELLTIFFCDQAFNSRLWSYLKRRQPKLAVTIHAIQNQLRQLEKGYAATATQEAIVFRRLQEYNLDISTEAFSLLSVAMAKRLSDLIYLEFKPQDRKAQDYLQFSRGIYPFLRDMPDLNRQWGNGLNIKRYGLDNYVVPDLMALSPEEAPTLSSMGKLWFKMVSNNDLNRWDFESFIKFVNTGYNLSSNHPPASLPTEQVKLLPLVAKYRQDLKHVTGADGHNAPNVLHGLARQDFRIETWPENRSHGTLRINRIDPSVLKELFPFIPNDEIEYLIWNLSNYSGEISLSAPLVLLLRPVFKLRTDRAVDMLFELNGRQVMFPEISRHFEAIYSPTYMARIALPKETDQAYVDALNEVVRRSHALQGGYTPKYIVLPAPLKTLHAE